MAGCPTMNTAAAPSAPLMSPSRTLTSNARLSPSSFGFFRTTTASSTPLPSFWKVETVAFGGSFAKLSLPDAQSSTMRLVRSWPAERAGRSAKTIAFGETPVKTSLPFCSVAPLELSTNSEGTTSCCVVGAPIFFWRGTWAGGEAVCANVAPAMTRLAPATPPPRKKLKVIGLSHVRVNSVRREAPRAPLILTQIKGRQLNPRPTCYGPSRRRGQYSKKFNYLTKRFCASPSMGVALAKLKHFFVRLTKRNGCPPVVRDHRESQ